MGRKVKDTPEWLNDDYFAAKLPEQMHMWTLSHGWKTDMLKGTGLSLLEVFFSSAIEAEQGKRACYGVNRPRFLKISKTVIQRGSYGYTTACMTGSYGFRASSTNTVNEVLTEIAQTDGFENFKLLDVKLYNADIGVEIYFKRYNPNGKGNDLYLFSAKSDDWIKEYKEINYYDQQRYLGNFYDEVAACKLSNKLVADCAIHPRY